MSLQLSQVIIILHHLLLSARDDKDVDEGYRICSCDGTQEKSLSTGSVPSGEVKPITSFIYQFKNDEIRKLDNEALTFDVLFTDDCSSGRCRQSGRMRCPSGKDDLCFRVWAYAHPSEKGNQFLSYYSINAIDFTCVELNLGTIL